MSIPDSKSVRLLPNFLGVLYNSYSFFNCALIAAMLSKRNNTGHYFPCKCANAKSTSGRRLSTRGSVTGTNSAAMTSLA